MALLDLRDLQEEMGPQDSLDPVDQPGNREPQEIPGLQDLKVREEAQEQEVRFCLFNTKLNSFQDDSYTMSKTNYV